jgi:hypothetical protein
MTKSFGARLRAERERKGIGLDAIAHSTKINRWLFEALERDDASRWPSGLFRRAFMRAYANEIGLDAEATVREFLERFPDPEEPAVRHSSSADAGALRLTLADEPTSFTRVNMLLTWSRSAAAAAYDLAVVIAVAAAVFAIAGQFWTSLTIASLCYYLGGVLILGNSPGGWMVSRRRKAMRSADSTVAAAPRKPDKAADPDEASLEDAAGVAATVWL